MFAKILLAAGLAAQVSAVTHRIDVGKSGLVFAPNSTTAAQGDIIEFHFYARNHSVVQGDFDNACVPAASNAFFSGFFPTNGTAQNAKVFSVTINDTNPIVYYCSQNTGAHCANGMVGVINPSGSKSLESYREKAKSVQTARSPPAVFGGVIGDASQNATASTSAGASGSTTVPTSGTTTPTASTTGAAATQSHNAAAPIKASLGGLGVAAVLGFVLA